MTMGDGGLGRRAPHLVAAIIACGIGIAILGGGKLLAIHLEKETIHTTAPQDFFIKNQGLALQRVAARTPRILLLYGSSELTDPIPNRADEFFANASNGFEICPVGKAGATPLTMVERIAAVGSELRGGKIAISISPSFFLRRELKADSYAGNFSLLAASATIFGTVLDFQLKSEIAKRMEQFPDTLEKSTLLRLAVHCLASGRPIDRALFVSIWPLGVFQNAIFDLQDHFATLVYILSGEKKVSRRELHEILEPLEPGAEDAEQNVKVRGGGALFKLGADGFQERVADAMGWVDLELLFRALTELRVQVLVLSLPLDGTLYDANGIPWSARQFYYDKLRDVAQRHGVRLMEFEDHDRDSSFQVFHREHPTAEGWIYYDLGLNNFFHTRKWDRP